MPLHRGSDQAGEERMGSGRLALELGVELHRDKPRMIDKLDDLRISRLLERIAEPTMGQVFLTDAREERTRLLMTDSGIPFQLLPITPKA